MEVIIAVDPGYSTGVVAIDLEGGIVAGRVIEINNALEELLNLVDENETRLVIVEDFVGAGPRTKEAIFVLKLIGAIRGACYVKKIPFLVQVPQKRIPYVPDAKRHAAPGTSRHIIDALAHVLCWMDSLEVV